MKGLAETLGLLAEFLKLEQQGMAPEQGPVRRVAGGMNNALFRIELEAGPVAVKLCVPDERRRAYREFSALQILRSEGLDLAPEPLGLDESQEVVPYPAVVYTWDPGAPAGIPLASGQVREITASVQAMHAIQRPGREGAGLLEAWFHWFQPEPYLAELDELLGRYGPWLQAASLEGDRLYARLKKILRQCEERLRGGRAAALIRREALVPCLCHVDANLRNALWQADGKLHWVDWEYSGWGDPALDLADFRWHGVLRGLSAAWHDELRSGYQPPGVDPWFFERAALWDALLASRWPLLVLRRYWSQFHGPDRLRLTGEPSQPGDLWRQLIDLVERSEGFFGG